MIHNNLHMAYIMILSGLLSSMYVWSDKWSDVRISLNDFYMIGLMTSWMFFFMALIDFDKTLLVGSICSIVLFFVCIRKQVGITRNQYFTGMIPHHSMAVLMSKRLIEKEELNENEKRFVENIIRTQEAEINFMNFSKKFS